ncbi:hypothetical protein IMY05_C4744000200 [Salix suchowensis]|nr:hypothetical protein IMY05_C4744000200 [Salix suchowensis]
MSCDRWVSPRRVEQGKGGIQDICGSTEDLEFGKIVMIRKKKSRARLDGVRTQEGGKRNGGHQLGKEGGEGQTQKTKAKCLVLASTNTQSGPSGNVNANQGSIALRAMIGSWAQLRNGDDEETAANGEEEEEEEVQEEVTDFVHIESSFEVGALSPARLLCPSVSHDGSLKEAKSLGKKRSTLLGLGLLSTMTMCLPSVHGGSNTSLILVNETNPSSNMLAPGTASVGCVFLTGRDCVWLSIPHQQRSATKVICDKNLA